MKWVLILIELTANDVTAHRLSEHPDIITCFEARAEIAWKGMQGPELICMREKDGTEPKPDPSLR